MKSFAAVHKSRQREGRLDRTLSRYHFTYHLVQRGAEFEAVAGAAAAQAKDLEVRSLSGRCG